MFILETWRSVRNQQRHARTGTQNNPLMAPTALQHNTKVYNHTYQRCPEASA